jgi:hypothetical protein
MTSTLLALLTVFYQLTPLFLLFSDFNIDSPNKLSQLNTVYLFCTSNKVPQVPQTPDFIAPENQPSVNLRKPSKSCDKTCLHNFLDREF